MFSFSAPTSTATSSCTTRPIPVRQTAGAAGNRTCPQPVISRRQLTLLPLAGQLFVSTSSCATRPMTPTTAGSGTRPIRPIPLGVLVGRVTMVRTSMPRLVGWYPGMLQPLRWATKTSTSLPRPMTALPITTGTCATATTRGILSRLDRSKIDLPYDKGLKANQVCLHSQRTLAVERPGRG